ncbi:DUF1345 domain-containing protein [Hymenobacter mucosus]|nr:DUF1345 domain-containing protein [Hymenobacter mucosus]
MAASSSTPDGFLMRRVAELPAWQRLALGVLPAALLYAVIPSSWPLLLRLLVAWDGFALSTLLLTWAIILTADVHDIRRVATREDPGRVASFGFVLVAAGASLVAVVVLLASMRQTADPLLWPHVLASIAGVATAWLLVHTLFTLRYAHLFYGVAAGHSVGGLEFPGNEPEPDYLDFAYFSFVIGMTAQTADVSISGRRIRRLCLLHGLLSFGFNTAVVALTISGLAGLL